MSTKVEGDRDKLKGLVNMMTRESKALHGSRGDLSRECEGNRAKIAGLIFLLEEEET